MMGNSLFQLEHEKLVTPFKCFAYLYDNQSFHVNISSGRQNSDCFFFHLLNKKKFLENRDKKLLVLSSNLRLHAFCESQLVVRGSGLDLIFIYSPIFNHIRVFIIY